MSETHQMRGPEHQRPATAAPSRNLQFFNQFFCFFKIQSGMPIIEIIASTVDDCINIEKGGATRIELVSALQVGGLTPSHGLIEKAVKSVSIPVNVMIRPHSDSFVYSSADIAVMAADIRVCKQLNASGIVLGVLDGQKSIDIPAMKRLLAQADGLDVTFHKAFDQTPDLLQSLGILKELKQVRRVLTQGGTEPILGNTESLAGIVANKGDMKILLGGGLKLDNIKQVQKRFGDCEYHFGTAVRKNNQVKPQLVHELCNLISQI